MFSKASNVAASTTAMTNLPHGAIITYFYLIIFMNQVFHHTQNRIIYRTAYIQFMRLLRKTKFVLFILKSQPSCHYPMSVMHYTTFNVSNFPINNYQLTTGSIHNINIFTLYLGIMCFIANDTSHNIICVTFYIIAYNEKSVA